MLNRLVHKVLFTNELIPYQKHHEHGPDGAMKVKISEPKNLKYAIEGVGEE